jgi:hypothetical protein
VRIVEGGCGVCGPRGWRQRLARTSQYRSFALEPLCNEFFMRRVRLGIPFSPWFDVSQIKYTCSPSNQNRRVSRDKAQ